MKFVTILTIPPIGAGIGLNYEELGVQKCFLIQK